MRIKSLDSFKSALILHNPSCYHLRPVRGSVFSFVRFQKTFLDEGRNMRFFRMAFFIQNPFLQSLMVTRDLKECALNFEQAMECITSKKKDKADFFREEVARLRMKIQKLEYEGILRRSFFQRSVVRPTIGYHYIRAHARIALHMEKVLEWILVREDAVSDPLETELFLLADAAGETVAELETLAQNAGRWLKRSTARNRKSARKKAFEIIEKTDHAQGIARRTRAKILENSNSPVSMVHLMELATLIEKITEESDEIVRLIFFVLNSPV